MVINTLKKIKQKIAPRPLTLTQLGRKNKTDKVDKHHSFAGKNYLDVYEKYLSPLRHQPITLLEIGIRSGASLCTFRDFFPKGNILGLDINPETAFTEPRIKTYIGSQDDKAIMDKISNENGALSVVLDDGSHINELTIASFHLLFEKLAPGGYYIIEDLGCSYLEENLARDIEVGKWPGMDLNSKSIALVNHREDMNLFFQKMITDLDHRTGEVEYIHFWSQLCVIKKIGQLFNV